MLNEEKNEVKKILGKNTLYWKVVCSFLYGNYI